MVASINQLIDLHLGGSKSRFEVTKLKKEIAHLRAIADITDRVSGSNEVYYEIFDGTNDMSVGKIDLATSTITGVNVANPTLFKVGQEVTIHNGTTKEVRTITNIAENTFTFDTPPTITEGTICRSMTILKDGKLHLHPSSMLQHDIRLNIDLSGDEEKAYSIVSWVEEETVMNIDNYNHSVEDTFVPPVMNV